MSKSEAGPESEVESESQPVVRLSDHPVPEHPPPPGHQREQWAGWKAWNRYCSIRTQYEQVDVLNQVIMPVLQHYYRLNESHPGYIELPEMCFPDPPDYTNYDYDKLHEYVRECFSRTLEIALPNNTHRNNKECRTRQTTLGLYLSMYQPLQIPTSTATVRLLEILPAVAEDETIHTRLFTTDLDTATVDYDALSYAWGEHATSGPKQSIYVNGFKTNITYNLFSALSSIRQPSKSRILWVDSVCINQADLQERQHQVQLMARIYTGARKVVVYLGAATSASNTVMRTLQSAGPGLFPESNNDTDDDDTDDDDTESGRPFWKLCHDAGQELIEGFIDISSRSWWSRVWILQEYTLHRKDPIIHCGRLHVENRVFSQYFERLYNWVLHRRRHPIISGDCKHRFCNISYLTEPTNDGLLPTDGKDKEPALKTQRRQILGLKTRRNVFFPDRISRGREWTRWARQAWKVQTILRGRQTCEGLPTTRFKTLGTESTCSIPHDIVYGLRELRDPLFRSLFPPDYMMRLSTLFARYAAYMIIIDGNMDIFWYYPHRLRDRVESEVQLTLGGGAADRDVPSWIPDFTRPRIYRSGDEHPEQMKPKIKDWNFAGRILNRVLLMNGILLDEIVDVFPLPSDEPFLLLQQLWYVERKHWGPTYLNKKPLDDGTGRDQSDAIFYEMLDKLGGIYYYPSIAWLMAGDDRWKFDISLVNVLAATTDLRSLIDREFSSCQAKIPKVVDILMKKGATRPPAHNEEAAETAFLTSKISNLNLCIEDHQKESVSDSQSLIHAMEWRLVDMITWLNDDPTWTDFVGICIFDYDNFRSQIVHRLSMWSAQRTADVMGDSPGFEYLLQGLGPRENTAKWAVTHEPFHYTEFIKAVDNNRDPLEIRLREAFLIGLATKIRRLMRDMVGLEGIKTFEDVNAGEVRKGSLDASKGSGLMVCMCPVHAFVETSSNQHEEDDATDNEFKLLDLPHRRRDHPHGSMIRWSQEPRKVNYDVHCLVYDIVETLAGRELFVTETGLAGITTAGTTGIQDGDDLLLIEGMSNLLVGRLEPNAQLGNPKKRRREMPTIRMKREILGTAIAKGIDTRGGKVDEAIVPSWFEDITRGRRGVFRFS